MITIFVNGKATTTVLDTSKTLLTYLREDLGLVGTKNGCGEGHCGTCTILINHEAKRACITKLSACENKYIETIESLGQEDDLHPLQQAFIDEGAVQCGFCTPGMLMASKGLLDKNPHPTANEIKYALRNNLCRCTGYGAIIRAVQKAAVVLANDENDKVNVEQANVEQTDQADHKEKDKYHGRIGTNVAKKDAIPKVIGQGVFAGDMVLPHMVYGKILFSEHAHARIKAIHLDEALALEGVDKIVTYKDIEALGGLNKFGLFVPQQPVLAKDKVKYLGDVIACVYARTEAIAVKARALIRVIYEPLKAQLDPHENMLESAECIHEDAEHNIVHHVSVRKGDLESGFEQADVIVENIYQTQAVEHAYLEPESCMARIKEDGLVLYSGSQGSEAYRRMIAAALNLPIEKVRVVFTATGGGFGGKEEPTVQILAALGTWLMKKPVKMVLTREESIRMSTKRHPMHIWMKHGVTKDGRIVAMKSKVIGDAGAYISQTNPVIFRSAVTASGPYITENVEADSYGVYTHKNPSGAFRGFGSTQASFACESQMDQLAEKIGMSPFELRLKNAFKAGVETSTGQVLRDGVGYVETLKAAQEGLLRMKEEFSTQQRAPHIKIGYGLGSAYKNVGVGTGKPDKAGAYVEVTQMGRILVSMGAADMGQGVDTTMAQIGATVLHIPYELIDVKACDTKHCPDGGMTTASRQTYVTGNAVKEASEQLRKILVELHGSESLFEMTNHEQLQEQLQKLYLKGIEQGKKLRIEHDYFPPKTVPHKVDANRKPHEAHEDYDIHYSYCFATASVAVEVNTETGEIRVLKVCAAQDVGKALHPKNIIGQIEGSVAMGIGLALSEEFVVDDKIIYQNNLKKLKLINSLNMPDVESIIIEEEQIDGPFGAKGMGEVGLNPIAPAIANAIYDATGVRLTKLPMKW